MRRWIGLGMDVSGSPRYIQARITPHQYIAVNGMPTSDDSVEGQSDSDLTNLDYEPDGLGTRSRTSSGVNKDSITNIQLGISAKIKCKSATVLRNSKSFSKIFEQPQPILSFSLWQ